MMITNRTFTNCFLWIITLFSPFLAIEISSAQCGSVGDPIINITFGTSSDPDFDPRSTTYRLNQYGQLADGEYKLGSNINQARNSWHNLADHTASDEEGLMFIVNASYGAGEFYRNRVRGLCERTTFVFSAWIAVANPPTECQDEGLQLPNVRFVIEDTEGNTIASRSTGDIDATAQPRWIRYEFVFETDNHTEFDLVLINDNPGGCGNDLAIDDIQFRPCGPEIVLDMDMTFKQGDTLFFCAGTTAPIRIGSHVISNDGYMSDPVFQWQTRQNDQAEWRDIPGENNNELMIVPVPDRWYRLSATASNDNLDNQLCRVMSDAVRLAQLVVQTNVPDEDSRLLCENDSVNLNPPEYTAENAGPMTYQWQLDEGDGPTDIPDAKSAGYVFRPVSSGTVLLKRDAINSCGYRFTTHRYEIEVTEAVGTAFGLSTDRVCADDQPLRLEGGIVVNGNGDIAGVYSGNGVSNGFFYPDIAGVGQHTITFSLPSGALCAEPSHATITVYDTVSLDPMEDMVIVPGQRVTLRPRTNASQFSWSNQPGLDSYHAQYPVASPDVSTTYRLTAGNAAGCVKVGEVTVTVLQNLVLPNSFSPNGDGINDSWEIEGLADYPKAFIQIFNRWGTLVYSSRGYHTPWNGQYNGVPLPFGTYYYTLSSDVLERPLSGTVSILR